jgi:hypothetical protein
MSHPDRAAFARYLDLLPVERLPAAGALSSAAILAFGVLALDWSPAAVMGLFWLENVIHGGFHALRMQSLNGRMVDAELHRALERAGHLDPVERQRQLEAASGCMHDVSIPLFLLHYGAFCAVHLLFVALLFPDWATGYATAGGLAAIAMMLLSHGQVTLKFRRQPELKPLPRMIYMFAAYDRIFVLHLALMAGGALMWFGAARSAVLLLIGLKLWSDLSGGFSLIGRIRRWAHAAP